MQHAYVVVLKLGGKYKTFQLIKFIIFLKMKRDLEIHMQ